jgi:ribosomal protein S12 methylthiotransferase
VGFPGETEAEFRELLDFLAEAELDRVGCFAYSPVEGAAANALADPVPEAIKAERRERLMVAQAAISTRRLARKVGQTLEVLVDAPADAGGAGGSKGARRGRAAVYGAVGRSRGDAPEIDGLVHLSSKAPVAVGDRVMARIIRSDEHDLWGEVQGAADNS